MEDVENGEDFAFVLSDRGTRSIYVERKRFIVVLEVLFPCVSSISSRHARVGGFRFDMSKIR